MPTAAPPSGWLGNVEPAVLPIRDLNPTTRITAATWLMIAIAAVVFVFVQPHSPGPSATFMYEQAAIPCEVTSAESLTITEINSGICSDQSGRQLDPNKRVYLSIIVSVFLHGSVMHLLGNLWVLWIFGNNVEDRFGSTRFTLFFLASGIAATIGHVALYPDNTTPVVGASGAIAGVMGAYLVLHPWARVVAIVPPLFFLPFRVPAAVFLAIWFALQFALADQDTNIAWEAHVVGFVFGLVVAGVLRATGRVNPSTIR